MTTANQSSLLTFATLLKPVLHQCHPDLTSIDISLVAKLDELGAFARLPCLRFIISTAIKSGAARRFVAAADDDGAQQEIERFLIHTGFREEAAHIFFDTLESLCNRGTSSASAPAASNRVANYKTEAESEPNNASACELSAFYESPHATTPKGCTYQRSTPVSDYTPALMRLNAILSINRENEAARGVSIDSPSVTDITPKGIVVTCVLRRTAPMGSGALHCAIFDTAGTLKETIMCGVLTVGGPSVLPLKNTVSIAGGIIPGSILLWID